MNRFLLLLSFIYLSIVTNAQLNLVQNYSFEQYNLCPQGVSFFDSCVVDWFTPISKMKDIPNDPNFSLGNGGSSDYYHICATNSSVKIPKNIGGYQQPRTGVAYCGIFLISTATPFFVNAKEYIETQLMIPLKTNKKYHIEFFYSIAEYSNNQDYYSLELGALITDTVVYRLSGIGTEQPQNINTIPQVKQQLPLVKDTFNWIKVSGSFIAKGGEKFITIGSFQNTDTLIDRTVYVYIDDVKLYYCGPDTTQPPVVDSLIIPNVFTPNGDGFNDKFEYKNQEQWEFETQIFSRWGNMVFDNNSSQNWDGTYKGEKVSPGVYFYIIKGQAIKTGEIKIYRGTLTVMY